MQESNKKIVENKKQINFFIEFIIYLLFGLGPLTGNVILVLFGVLSSEFSVNPSTILIAIPSFMFPFAITQLFSGAISDIIGRIKVILFGLFIFGIGMTLAAVSFSLMIYIIANILGGIGFGFVNPVLIALMTDFTTGPYISKKMGYLGAVANLGVGLGPIIAGQLVVFSWRYLYLIFIIIIAFSSIYMIFLKKQYQKPNQRVGLRLFFMHLSQEIRRFVIIVMILSAFLISQTYLAIITWTSRSFTGIIPENIAGIIIGSAGITGAIAGIISGIIIKIKGIKFAIIIGLISLYSSVIIFLILGDITEMRFILYTTIGLILTGAAGGILIPSMMYYSQILSKKRRGALAGLVTAGQFIGIALVPITYDWLYHYGGIKMVYFMVLGISVFLVFILIILYNVAKKDVNLKMEYRK